MSYILQQLKNSRKAQYIIRSLIVLAFLVSVFAYVRASSSGRVGATNSGCTCHGSANSATTVTVSAQSGSFSVETGSTSTYTVTVSNTSKNYFGVDIGVKTTSNGETNAGTLAATNSDLRLSSGELTHQSPKNGSGSTTFTFTWTAPTQAGTYYLKAVGNAVDNNGANSGDQWNTMTVQSITVVAPTELVLTAPNGGENWCAGVSKNITWTSSNVTNINIDLSTNGGSSFSSTLATNISASSGTWAWNIPSGQAVGNQYKIRISDASNANINDVSAANFAIAPVTSITSHPQSVSTCSGLQVQLSVTASGSGLSYKWRKDGADVPGGTSATLTLSNVQTANAGTYSCVVSGSCGNPLTSNSATVTVEAAPQITEHPTNQAVCVNKPVSFSVAATGEQLTYKWKKNGAIVPNGTAATLTISSAKESDAGSYVCEVSGKCQPVVTSNPAQLTVNLSPVISVQPKPATVCESKDGFIFVTATGNNLVYVWMKNGVEIANTNNDTLFLKKIALADAGFYSVKISGSCSPEVTSGAASVTINPLALITQQPEDQTVTEGNSASFTVAADGQGITYQWFKNGEKLAGKTASILNLSAVKLTDAGSYFCDITNSCGTKSSDTVTLSVIPAGNGPVFTLSRTSLDYEFVEVNSKVQKILPSVIINTGNEALTITDFAISGPDASLFSVDNLQLPITLNQSQTLDLSISFEPNAIGDKTATLEFTSNSATSPQLKLLGKGVSYDIQSSVSELTINAEKAGDKGTGVLSLTNNSSIDINIGTSIIGGDSLLFSLQEILSDFLLKIGETKDISVDYNSDTWQTKQAELVISLKQSGKQIVIPIKGSVLTDITEFDKRTHVVYPNPSSGDITIDLSEISEEIISVNMFDNLGKNVSDIESNSAVLSGNIGTIVFKQTNLISGKYTLVIKTPLRTYTYPIVIMR